MTRLILVLVCLVAAAFAAPIALPATFMTTKGSEIKNGKVTAQTATAIKVMHDGGIATVPHDQLPPEVLALLGITAVASAAPTVPLPDPFPNPRGNYDKPELLGVDPDGLRIKHAAGTAKVRYEDLPLGMLEAFGPFSAKSAASFREAEAERNRAAYVAIREAINASQKKYADAQAAEQKVLEEQKAKFIADPNLISPVIAVQISGYSDGGKDRDTTFQTTYGSYARTEVSFRNMHCFVTSKIKGLQRARMQCLFLTRDVDGAQRLNYEIVADDKVSLGPQATKMVSASAETTQSDEKYAALGLRYREGAKYVGWCWRAIDGQGRISAVYSSTPVYDRHAWEAPIE